MLRGLIVAALVATLCLVALTLSSPRVAVGARSTDAAIALRIGERTILARRETPVAIDPLDDHAVVVVPAWTMTHAIPSTASAGTFLRARDAVAGVFAHGPGVLSVVDVRGTRHAATIAPRPRRLGDLGPSYWMTVVAGLAGVVFGFCVWAMKPDDWGPRMFAIVGVGLFVAAATAAIDVARDLGSSGREIQALVVANLISLHVFAAAFLALFARFPQPLVPARIVAALAIPPILAFAAAFAPRLHEPAMIVFAVELVMLLPMIAAQAWAARRSPEHRAMLAIVAASVVLGTILYLAVIILPRRLGFVPPLASDETFPLFVLIYAGIGVATVRAELFARGGWPLRVMVSICATLLILLLDVVIFNLVVARSGVALGLAIGAVALLYFPLHALLLSRAERRREERSRELLRIATSLAFAVDRPALAAMWREAIDRLFDPLGVADSAEAVAAPTIVDGGTVLLLPALDGGRPLELRHAGGGRRLFSSDDVAAASELIRLIDRLVAARESYVHGAAEERRRIARDLHDDVGGRLIASLHREDPAAMRHDVHEAVAGIRTIVDGIGGEHRPLGELLADLRHEAHRRLDAEGIALDWPVTAAFDDPRPLDYALYRHLVSIVRETVSNIVRHAGATRVEVAVAVRDGILSLAIADDGCGLAANVRRGHGLRNCERRAADLGGRFAIASEGGGTAIAVDLPLAVLPGTGDGPVLQEA